MLLAPLLRNMLMYGGLAIVAISIIVLRELMRRRPAQRIPDATVISRAAERRRFAGLVSTTCHRPPCRTASISAWRFASG